MGSFELADLFKQQFGITPQQFKFESVEKSLDKLSEFESKAKKGAPLYWDDAFGRFYFMPVFLQPDGSDPIPLSYPVTSITCSKTIIETPLTERNGTVKEFINQQDYKINIRGFLIGKENEWPENAITQLYDLYKKKEAMTMISPLTDIFLLNDERKGNDKVVIKTLRFPENKGDIRVRAYEMELVSDEGFSLNEIA